MNIAWLGMLLNDQFQGVYFNATINERKGRRASPDQSNPYDNGPSENLKSFIEPVSQTKWFSTFRLSEVYDV